MSLLSFAFLILTPSSAFTYITPTFSNVLITAPTQTLRVGLDKNFPPHEWAEWDNETQQWKVYGFNIEIIKEIASRMGTEIEFYPMTWSNAYDSLRNGSIDILCMAANPSRQEFFDFSDPILPIELAIFVREGVKVDSIFELANHTVAVEKGDIAGITLQDLVPSAIIVETDSQEQALELVHRGDVYAFLGNYHTGIFLIHQKGYEASIRQSGNKIPIGNRVIAVTKGNTTLLDEINYCLQLMKQDQTYYRIYAKWYGGSYTVIAIPHHTWFIIFGIFGIIFIISIGVILWNRELSKKVQLSTQELRSLNDQLRLISDIVSHDIGNIVHQMINTIELMEYKQTLDIAVYRQNVTAIFLKYKIAQEFIELLTIKKPPKKEDVINLLYQRFLFSQFMYNASYDLCIISDPLMTKEIFILANPSFETVLDYLFFETQKQTPESSVITIYIYKVSTHSLAIEFPINATKLLEKQERGDQIASNVSIEYLFIFHVMKKMHGSLVLNDDALTIIIPHL
ncbi:MAG: transporter substrate-binding domain-containing protein [Candidatus Heimdallarchaeaceae archaeon]